MTQKKKQETYHKINKKLFETQRIFLHRIEMESLCLLKFLKLVFPSLFDMQSQNYHQNHKADSKQGKNTLYDNFAGRHEKLNFPIVGIFQRRWDDEDLRVGNGLWPPSTSIRQSYLDEIYKIWCSTEA